MPVKESARALMLSYIANNCEALCREAKETKMSHSDFLDEVLDKELEFRRANRVQRKIREAHYPYRKYLQDLDLNEYDGQVRSVIENLSTLDFITDKRNAILIGNPGRGNYEKKMIMLRNGLSLLAVALRQPCSFA